MELLYFGYSHYTRSMDRVLEEHGLGRAHHRAMYFIARRPGLTVSELLSLLAITKQSLGRVVIELSERGLVTVKPGERDRRQRLMSLTPVGSLLEEELFDAGRARIARAYAHAGHAAVSGFWAVLEALVEPGELAQIERLREGGTAKA